jgi:Holliday junction resolvasome RuvABC DNA-binding subunit
MDEMRAIWLDEVETAWESFLQGDTSIKCAINTLVMLGFTEEVATQMIDTLKEERSVRSGVSDETRAEALREMQQLGQECDKDYN